MFFILVTKIKKHKFTISHKTFFKKMSTILMIFLHLYVFLLLLLSPPILRITSTTNLAEAARPLTETNVIPPPSYEVLKPKEAHGGQPHGFGSKGLESCLPKGFRRASAPSRYVNYHTLGSGSSLCDDSSKRVSMP